MAVSGAIETENDPRIGPVVAMSGPGGRVFTADALKEIGDPAMLMYGSEEETRANKGWGIDKQYEALSPPKFLMSIEGADHMTFAVNIYDKNLSDPKSQKEIQRQDLINRYVKAFFELYLLGDDGAKETLSQTDEGFEFYDYEF
jgi:predicted dienelactone hydrolase